MPCSAAATFQARYAAVDLAPPARRGRHLSLIVWGTTLGAVIGPSLAAGAGTAVARYGAPTLAGPFFFSTLLFGCATLLLLLFLRPDPAVVACRAIEAAGPALEQRGAGMGVALRLVSASPAARPRGKPFPKPTRRGRRARSRPGRSRPPRGAGR